jgi:hypothetical protein
MGDEQTTESEDRKEKDAAEAAERIKRGQHWLDWMYIAEGLEVGRVKAMRRAGTNRPIGAAYNRAFGDWLNERSWARDLPWRREDPVYADPRRVVREQDGCPAAETSGWVAGRSSATNARPFELAASTESGANRGVGSPLWRGGRRAARPTPERMTE